MKKKKKKADVSLISHVTQQIYRYYLFALAKIPQTVLGWKLSHFKAGSGPSVESHSTFCCSARCAACVAASPPAVFLMCLLCLLSLPLSHASWFLLGKSTASGQ